MKAALNLDFLDRTLRTSGIVLLIYLPFGLFYQGLFPALAVFSGGVWGIVNFIFLAGLIRAAIRPDGVNLRRVLILAAIKFPLLYGAGYCLTLVPGFTPLDLLIGFTIILAILTLRAVSRFMIDKQEEDEKNQNLQRAI